MLTRFFQDSDFIAVLQTGFGSGSGLLPLGSGLESDSKKLENEHLLCKPEMNGFGFLNPNPIRFFISKS